MLQHVDESDYIETGAPQFGPLERFPPQRHPVFRFRRSNPVRNGLGPQSFPPAVPAKLQEISVPGADIEDPMEFPEFRHNIDEIAVKALSPGVRFRRGVEWSAGLLPPPRPGLREKPEIRARTPCTQRYRNSRARTFGRRKQSPSGPSIRRNCIARPFDASGRVQPVLMPEHVTASVAPVPELLANSPSQINPHQQVQCGFQDVHFQRPLHRTRFSPP